MTVGIARLGRRAAPRRATRRSADQRLHRNLSRLGAALRAVLVNAPRPRASAARFAHTLRELAAAAHLQVGPEVISDFARTVGAV